jgi:hypothetical protein
MSKFVWVKQRNGNGQAFKVEHKKKGMDIDDLKNLIDDLKYKQFGRNQVQFIFSSVDSDAIDPGDAVPEPVNGEIGASSKTPYYYSIADQTQAGDFNYCVIILYCPFPISTLFYFLLSRSLFSPA